MAELRRMPGDTVKSFIGSDGRMRVKGHTIVYTSESHPDLHKQHFSKATDLGREIGWTLVGKPYLIEHALDDAFKGLPAGIFDMESEDEIGVYNEAWLHNKADYQEMLRQLNAKRNLGWDAATIDRKAAIAEAAVKTFHSHDPQFSSGGLPQRVEVNEDTGHIDTWYRIEASGTLTPAEPNGTEIAVAVKSAFDELKALLIPNRLLPGSPSHEDGQTPAQEPSRKDAGSADVEPNPPANGDAINSNPAKEMKMTPEEMQAYMQQYVQMVLDGVSAMLNKEETAETTLPSEAEVIAAVSPDMPTDEDNPEDMAKAAINKSYAFVQKFLAEKRKAREAGRNQLKRIMEAPDTLPAGGNGNGRHGIVEVNSMKYAHLSPLELAMAVKMAVAFAPRSLRPIAQRDVSEFMSEDLYKHAMHAMEAYHAQHELKRPEEQLALKSMRPFKAGELDASATTGAGLEYITVGYDTQVWELARNNTIYELMRSRGMMEKPVPQGQQSTIIPLEGTDPTVYGGTEATDLDAAGDPETVFQITPYATAQVTVTPGIFRVATGITDILEEDSLVNNVAEANRKIRLALEEHIEKAMLNGDTVTTASTNINTIDGTPTASGLTKSYYLEFNGLIKSPLITSTAYARDASGTLSSSDFLNTKALLPAEQQARKDSLFFVIDVWTQNAASKLADLKTKDVAGEQNTLFTGELPALWGIPVYTSGFLGKANTAGKVATGTPGNNTTGRILLVYAPYWAFSFKRQINIESMRFPQSETTGFYGSMRFSLTRRSPAAAALTFNVAI